VACRSPTKIPAERLYEMDKKLFWVSITLEGLEPANRGMSDDEGGMAMKVMMISMQTIVMIWKTARTWILIRVLRRLHRLP
jgi:hypothetical protein